MGTEGEVEEQGETGQRHLTVELFLIDLNNKSPESDIGVHAERSEK